MASRVPLDLSLYLVTDTVLCGGPRGVVDTVGAAVAGGVTAVQLRDPDATTRTLVELGGALRHALAGTGVALLVNDRADVAVAIGADGVHVGQDDLPAEAARAIVGPDRHVGLSIQTVRQLDDLARLPAGTVDYLGVGPVFAQRTKGDAAQPVGLDTLAAVAVKAALPVVAIGGITAGNAAGVLRSGAVGLAVVSAICGRDDPRAAARELRTFGTQKERKDRCEGDDR